MCSDLSSHCAFAAAGLDDAEIVRDWVIGGEAFRCYWRSLCSLGEVLASSGGEAVRCTAQ